MNWKEFFKPTVGKLVLPVIATAIVLWFPLVPTMSGGITPLGILVVILFFLIGYLVSCTTSFLKQKGFLRPTPGKLVAPALAILLTHISIIASLVLAPGRSLINVPVSVILFAYVLLPLLVALVVYPISCLIAYFASHDIERQQPSPILVPEKHVGSTRRSFSKIRWGISLLLVIFVAILESGGWWLLIAFGFIFRQVSQPDVPLSSLYIVPILFVIGCILFIAKTVQYVRRKEYFIETLRLSRIGGLMGLTWFATLYLVPIVFSFFTYSGTCAGFLGSSRECSLFAFIFGGLEGILYIFILPWFVLSPLVMFIIGFFVDRYIAKQIKIQ